MTFQDDVDLEKVKTSRRHKSFKSYWQWASDIAIICKQEHVFEANLQDISSNKVDIPPLRNPPKMENTDDLTNLSYLNEPSGMAIFTYIDSYYF
jgi:myosin heavy subunit